MSEQRHEWKGHAMRWGRQANRDFSVFRSGNRVGWGNATEAQMAREILRLAAALSAVKADQEEALIGWSKALDHLPDDWLRSSRDAYAALRARIAARDQPAPSRAPLDPEPNPAI